MATKEISLPYKKIKELRDGQELSFAKIAQELGANLQSVQACYEAGEDRVYRPRGKRKAAKANGNGHKVVKAKNGNGSHKNGKHRAAVKSSVREITDRFVAELRARGVEKLAIDLATGQVKVSQQNETSWRV